MSMIVVKAAYDAEAGVWFVESSDLPGLNAEAQSLEALRPKIEAAAEDLRLESHGRAGLVPIEIIAHASARARLSAAA